MRSVFLPHPSILTLSLILLIVINIAVFIASEQFLKISTDDSLTVSFLDVGQGDSTYIRTPDNYEVLIDAGPRDGDVVSHLQELRSFGDNSLDMIIATHPDADHIGGFPDVLQQYDVGATLEPHSSSTSAVYGAWRILTKEENVPNIIAKRGQRFMIGASTTLTILAPDRLYEETNDSSIIALLSYGTTCFLIMGDAPREREMQIISAKDSPSLTCDVLKAGHHGSDTSTDPRFLDGVKPTWVVVSAGKNNSYGHPHKSVIDIIQRSGSKLLLTAREGTITFESNGHEITKKEYHPVWWYLILEEIMK